MNSMLFVFFFMMLAHYQLVEGLTCGKMQCADPSIQYCWQIKCDGQRIHGKYSDLLNPDPIYFALFKILMNS
uniref:Uncharacterized protein n=1 Tax=Ditylenchus dipsaci TaxID=166011 RepID=A0A915DG27_9BILA